MTSIHFLHYLPTTSCSLRVSWPLDTHYLSSGSTKKLAKPTSQSGICLPSHNVLAFIVPAIDRLRDMTRYILYAWKGFLLSVSYCLTKRVYPFTLQVGHNYKKKALLTDPWQIACLPVNVAIRSHRSGSPSSISGLHIRRGESLCATFLTHQSFWKSDINALLSQKSISKPDRITNQFPVVPAPQSAVLAWPSLRCLFLRSWDRRGRSTPLHRET